MKNGPVQPSRLILPEGAKPEQPRPESDEVLWDKAAPKGPPQPIVRRFPEWFDSVADFIQEVVADHGIVMDFAIEKALDVVEYNYTRGAYGIDLFPKEQGGSALGRTELLMLAMPVAIEIYKKTVEDLAGDRKDEFVAKVKEALKAKGGDVPSGT